MKRQMYLVNRISPVNLLLLGMVIISVGALLKILKFDNAFTNIFLGVGLLVELYAIIRLLKFAHYFTSKVGKGEANKS